MGFSRDAVVLVGIVAGCGPRVVVDEDPEGETGSQDESGSQGEESPGPEETRGTTRGDDEPAASTGSSGADESVGDGGTIELCPEIQAESAYCMTFATDGAHLIGADSGASCPVPQIQYADLSVAWIGDDVFMCGSEGVMRVSLVDGAATSGGPGCVAVAAYSDGLVVVPGPLDPLSIYDSFDAVLAGTPSGTLDIDPHASRFTASGYNLYGAWHATDSIDVWDLITATKSGSIPLEGHDGWVMGISVVQQRLFMVTTDPDTLLIEFDATTGARVAEHFIDVLDPTGLACRRGG